MIQSRKSKFAIFLLIIGILTSTGFVLSYLIISNFSDNSNPYFICYGDVCCEYKVYNSNEFTGLENINISIEGNNVTFNQTLFSYCSPPITEPKNFGIHLSLVGSNLTLRENYDLKGAPPSRCLYLFIINGTIFNIPKGTYNLVFIFNEVYQVHILNIFEIII